MTYEDIYKLFKSETGIDGSLIDDYRPATPLYTDLKVSIPNAIVVWIKNGGKIIYISKT